MSKISLYFVRFLLIIYLSISCQARPENFIIQGQPAQPGQFPWHAFIQATKPSQPIQYCGGSLISANFVLTAAGPIKGALSAKIDLGSTNFFTPLVSMESQAFFIHPRYNPTGNQYDFALIRLPSNVQFNVNIAPITLPSMSQMGQTFDNFNGLVSGFGVTTIGSPFLSEKLLFAPQTVISNAVCSQSYSPAEIGPQVLCANVLNGQSACYGDTGGALAISFNGRLIHIGLVSFYPRQGCGAKMPVGYMRTTAALDWISLMTGIPILQ